MHVHMGHAIYIYIYVSYTYPYDVMQDSHELCTAQPLRSLRTRERSPRLRFALREGGLTVGPGPGQTLKGDGSHGLPPCLRLGGFPLAQLGNQNVKRSIRFGQVSI